MAFSGIEVVELVDETILGDVQRGGVRGQSAKYASGAAGDTAVVRQLIVTATRTVHTVACSQRAGGMNYILIGTSHPRAHDDCTEYNRL